MSSQDDLGMLWYGVSGVSFNPTDPSEVMLNTGITAPLLSDHPRALVAPHVSQTSLGSHPQQATISYGDPSMSQNNQMLYDPQTGDFINQTEYMYETYDGYEEDSANANNLNSHNQQLLMNSQNNLGEEEAVSYPKTKKPKVHQHPALKLKTPIAYQKDTDLNAIPIMKEGMAVCEKCGAIGVKHAFYGKERKYCSLACARPPMPMANIVSKAPGDSTKVALKGENTFSISTDGCDEGLKPCSYNPTSESFSYQSNPEDTHSSHTSLDSRGIPSPNVLSGTDINTPLKDSEESMFHSRKHPEEENHLNENSVNQVHNTLTPSPSPLPMVTPTYLPPPDHKDSLMESFEWESSYFNSELFDAVPVKSFKHTPMTECWDQITPGMKVEVSCREESIMRDAFWVATVITIHGYKASLRFEGFADDNSKDFWVNLCSEEVHPVGWCATQGKPLIPPKSIQYKYKDWKEFLMKRLTGARTLPTNFHTKVTESLKSRFRPGLNLEVVDKNRIAQMRVATVTKVIGQRLHLRYHGAPPDDNGFWCHEDAAIIHPVGWSREVGHEIVASQSYHEKCLEVAYDPDDATSDLFLDPHRTGLSSKMTSGEFFAEGMKLEAIDPLNLATICVATVMKVLSHNYLMIRIDSYDSDNTCSDWFCYHATSTSLFPAGFSEINGIRLTPPRGYEGRFSWFDYLNKTKAVAAPPSLFTREVPNHGFKVNMSLEATDLMDPRLVCVATVKEVKGRLLKIHFDGWEDEFDQWVDCQSSDIYPVGWCNLVGYKLEGPRLGVTAPQLQRKKLRGRGGRKGRSMSNRRGIENSSPLAAHTPTIGQFLATSGKRGKKPRYRGSTIDNQTLRENHSGSEDASAKQDFSNELSYCGNEISALSARRRRGRPRSRALGTSNRGNHPHLHSATRPMRTTRTVLSSYTNSEDDVSDETSSGVASLAESENSSEAWDVDPYPPHPLNHARDISNGNAYGTDTNCSNDNKTYIENRLTPLPSESCYPDPLKAPSLNFKNLSNHSNFFRDGSPKLESFFTTSQEKLIENVPLSDNSSDFQQVSSSFEAPLKEANEEKSMSNVIDSVTSAAVTSSSEENWSLMAGSNSKPLLAPPVPQSLPEDLLKEEPPIDTPENVEPKPIVASPNFIPRCSDRSRVPIGSKVQPQLRSQNDVGSLLKGNDSVAYCGDSFIAQVSSSFEEPLKEEDKEKLMSNVIDSVISASVTSSSEVNWRLPADSNSKTFLAPPASQSLPEETFKNEPQVDAPEDIEPKPIVASTNFIPRLIDGSPVPKGSKVQPKLWSQHDVAAFLKVNDCGAYCENFVAQRIDGSHLLKLTQNDVMELTGMKVGPSVKIQNLIQHLLAIVNPAQARYQATLLKRGLSFGKT